MSLEVEQTPLIPGLHQFVHQACGGGEAHRHTRLAGGQSQTEGDMGLAGAAVADGDDVLAVLMYSQRASCITSALFT